MLIVRAVEVSGSDRSTWLRECVEAGAVRELAEAARQDATTDTARPLGRVDVKTFGMERQSIVCPHPVNQRWVGLRSWTCLECGSTFRRRIG